MMASADTQALVSGQDQEPAPEQQELMDEI